MKKILLIDDSEHSREYTSKILQLAGYEVVTARNGKEGVTLASKEKPDLILCDIMMPELDGFGVLRALSGNSEMADVSFIFLTAKAERSERRKGMEMGADDYLTKPIDDRELVKAVESRMARMDAIRKEFTKDFKGLSEFMQVAGGDTLAQLTERQEVRVYSAKARVYTEGQHPGGIYFLIAGKVKTFGLHEGGKELITAMHNSGDFFGYQALLKETTYGDSTEAIEQSEICMIPKDTFFRLLHSSAQVSKKFVKMLANDRKDLEDQLLGLAYSSVRKRVADALVNLHDQSVKSDPSGGMNIPRDDLARIVGTATETIIRTLGDFRDEGLIDIEARLVVLKNYEQLAAMRN